MGKHMAAISQAFADLLQDTETGDARVLKKAKRAEKKAMKKYIKAMEGEQPTGEVNEDDEVAEEEEVEIEKSKEKRPSSSKKKHKKNKKTVEQAVDDELIVNLKANLATELSTAAKEEQEAIMERMKSHGTKIDGERKRQKDLLNERL
ncbi:unnamed protein product, partial [Echinostoma caproni]|uniref:RRP15-like protein n=1 Tax=Echinostoma caproni TaxID=27848 RepID=A0A183B615_9TREM